jgi:hypothetical protein
LPVIDWQAATNDIRTSRTATVLNARIICVLSLPLCVR